MNNLPVACPACTDLVYDDQPEDTARPDFPQTINASFMDNTETETERFTGENSPDSCDLVLFY